DDREADDRIDEVGIDVPAAEHADQQSRAVSQGEQRDVKRDVLQSIEKENHAREKREVIVPRHHVLRAEIDVRPNLRAAAAEQERLVVPADSVRPRCRAQEQAECGGDCSARSVQERPGRHAAKTRYLNDLRVQVEHRTSPPIRNARRTSIASAGPPLPSIYSVTRAPRCGLLSVYISTTCALIVTVFLDANEGDAGRDPSTSLAVPRSR